MNTRSCKLGAAALVLGQLITASAAVFTNDTLLNASNTNYDGQSIVISNCTLTVDGPHFFQSLHIGSSAVLTHTFAQNGIINLTTPITDEPQILSGTNAVTLANSNAVPSSVRVKDSTGTVIFTNAVDYTLSQPGDGTTRLQRTDTSNIPDGSLVLVSYEVTTGATIPSGLNLTVSGDLEVEASGVINANGKGYGGNQGAGNGGEAGSPFTGGGAGYGGFGGLSSSNAVGGSPYGSPFEPSALGSGGGASSAGVGGAGGGLVRISIGGRFLVNGTVTANGQDATNSRSGGGSGGSVWVTAQSFIGTGLITAHGGAGEPIHGGGGGGGRIAIGFMTNSFTGTIAAFGGNGAQRGGAGNVSLLPNNALGQVTFDNGGVPGASTLLAFTNAADLIVQGGARAGLSSPQILSNLIVRSNSSILPTTTNNATVTITVQAKAIFEKGASLSLDGNGWTPNQGPGAGSLSTVVSGGAGHGGYGGSGLSGTFVAPGGNAYDSLTSPTQWGSGARTVSIYPNILPGGSGGGVVRLTVGGNLQLDGTISANGTPGGYAGGGAGGGIWLTLGGLSGSGMISANGGSGLPNGGGGGGGRIAITYSSNSFAGTITAFGGAGGVPGGAGTIYTKTNSQTYANLFADNAGQIGTNTLLDVSGQYSILVLNGANLRTPLLSLTVNDLTVGTNAIFQFKTLSLLVSHNLTVASGGRMSGDGQGNLGTGLGLGLSSSVGSGGGGHAGNGGYGAGLDQTGRGGGTYDSTSGPTQLGGSGGGINLTGGAGGGALQLTVNGLLNLAGAISAAGNSAFTNNSGGGAGGSLWLTVNALSGSGAILADGGNGSLAGGGGGGGGRIALVFNPSGGIASNLFSGSISAKGGNGFMRGGAGTMYFNTNGANSAAVIVDNGGPRGTNTTLSISSGPPFDLTVQNGAVANQIGTPRDLFVRTNGLVNQPGNITVSRNVTIEMGGALAVDAVTALGPSPGYSSQSVRGGGGHGGYGGLNPLGGNVYGYALSPTTSGSSGGNGSGASTGSPYGGFGGGAVHLTVPNTILLNGRISANGANGDLNSGGGSGGSVWLTVGTFSGNGQITATGGSGNGFAGGGGGGRVAVYYTGNSFTGTVLACGGPGYSAGGAGTIYLKANSQPGGTLLVDNCGLSGTNTPLSQAFGLGTNLIVSGGAIAEAQGPIPLLSNVVVSAGSVLTGRALDTNLSLGILGDLRIEAAGALMMDAKGYLRTIGPGAGASLSNKGAGGGYGGIGGPSASGAPGGTNYGSPTQPIDRGSGGGIGGSNFPAGSDGGGALRLSVGGTLSVDGRLAANGGPGLQDDSGGGSGGSVWVTAGNITGSGLISADGGPGELLGGGGGAGGRIALYSPLNTYTGLVSVAGGGGATSGQTGTVFTSQNLASFQVISHSPTGVVSNTVTHVDLIFNEVVNPFSIAASNFVLFTPAGSVQQSNLTISLLGLTSLRVSFPEQNLVGDYRIQAGPGIDDVFGRPMSQVYTGAFSIVLPAISGIVTHSNGTPAVGVAVQPSGGLQPAVTDDQGNYSVGVPPGWTGTVTPSLPGWMFVPGTRSYTYVQTPVSDQNYLMVSTIAPTLTAGRTGANFGLKWYGIGNVYYQPYWSTNLSDWYPLVDPLPGTNGPFELLFPIDADPTKFFRVKAQN